MKTKRAKGVLVSFLTLIMAIPIYTQAGVLPDTGQIHCYDSDKEITCPQPGAAFYGQDACYTVNPLSYTKLDAGGADLPVSADSWSVVRDNVTGLIWEVKHAQGGDSDYTNPHDPENMYTWYDSNSSTNGGDAGTPRDGRDTEDFIRSINDANLGGYSDWRLPSRKELLSIVNYGEPYPSINKAYFPNTIGFNYWSTTTHPTNASSAAYVCFSSGSYGRCSNKSESKYARAVCGNQTKASEHLIINGDGTVTDTSTWLMWQQATAPDTYTWEQALSYCENLSLAGYTDWRLPNIRELSSISILSYEGPAIDIDYFPDTMRYLYWSSTTNVRYPENAWLIDFTNSFGDHLNKSRSYHVRAVRGGQQGTLEICDGIDNDSDGKVDGNFIQYSGTDEGECQRGIKSCTGGQMVQTQEEIGPEEEIFDGLDNDCDGEIDEGFSIQAYYGDCDGDGYGDPDDFIESHYQPDGYVLDNTDCSDNNPNIHPGVTESLDGIDNDCDGQIDEGFIPQAFHVDDDYPLSEDTDRDLNFKHIQTAINNSNNGDEIIVHPGIYYENINFMGKTITLKGTDPNELTIVATTIIDGNNAGRVITFNNEEDNNSVLSGFTIRGGLEEHGAGIYCHYKASPTITKCIIANNSGNSGGGIHCSNCSPIITQCLITQNMATPGQYVPDGEGSGIYCSKASPLIENCVIVKNAVGRLGGGIYLFDYSHPRIINCTIADNAVSEAGGGIFCQRYCSPLIINCILWNNSPQEIYVAIDGGNPTVIYSDIFAGYTGEGNKFSDPLFINPRGGDYQLQLTSPCIDAGTNINAPIEDIHGISRPLDGDNNSTAIHDMGAYELFIEQDQPYEPDQNQPVDQDEPPQFDTNQPVEIDQNYPVKSNQDKSNSSSGICFLSIIHMYCSEVIER